jgi:hypothetical protein
MAELKFCEICNEKITKKGNKRFCSRKCTDNWQSKFRVGKNSANYKDEFTQEDRTKYCEWCGEKFEVSPHQIATSRFCSKICRQGWYSNIYSKSKEWKDKARKNVINMLEKGLIKTTRSNIQLSVDKMLDFLNVKYINEKSLCFYNVDNYLLESNLVIENMGTFWHCDNRFYSNINYDIQINRIRLDKSKHNTIKNSHNIEILYLWEYDIINNPQLCMELIKTYIENNGALSNYHSFNYSLINNNIVLNKEMIYPYMSWDINELNKIVDITLKEKLNRKQVEKWIRFECEYCKTERDELLSHYNKQKHHFCSSKCASEFHKNRVSVNCSCCNKIIGVTEYKYNKSKSKRFFCNKDCTHKYQRDFGFKKNGRTYIEFNCNYCNKTASQYMGDYKKKNKKYHYCSKKCAILHRYEIKKQK